jgi:methylthioribose-1-phosphate isomerase
MESPLLFPVKLVNNKIIVLDETKLPFKEEYLEVENLEDALDVLGEMKTRAFGQVLLFFYCCIIEKLSPLQIATKFKERRPTFDFLMLANLVEKISQGKNLKEAIISFIDGFDYARRKRAQYLASKLPNPANILTICNVNGELLYLYEELKKIKKEACFYACETRPYLQGTRLTFWELNKNNIPSKLICDNQVAILMKNKVVNCIVVGADRASIRGDIINKIGTYSLAILGKYFNIPFYALTQYPRPIDIEDIEIEERPQEEVFMFLKEKAESIYPCFDITPFNYIKESVKLEFS